MRIIVVVSKEENFMLLIQLIMKRVLQHLSINLSVQLKTMGQIHTKPIDNELLISLQQSYEPYAKGNLLPGQPIHIKSISHTSINPSLAQIALKYKKLDHYCFAYKLNEQNLKRERAIYDNRKTNLPCLVQIIYYEISKQDCQCLNNTYKVTVYTEHVEKRLANFKSNKNGKNIKVTDCQNLDSFSLDEGIYVLINTLHAYQLLCEQYHVNYPTPFTIGINSKAQVKTWINENWSINAENHRILQQNLIIQEIIHLIQERMVGSFSQILNLRYNYINFTFDSIQEVLSNYTINFHKGKQSLEGRINKQSLNSSNRDVRPRIYSDKISVAIKKVPQTSQFQTFTAEPSRDHFKNIKIPEKRCSSQDIIKNSNNQSVPLSYSCKKPSYTPRTSTMNQSPKKVIKFTYQHTQSSSKPASPKMQTPKKSSFPEGMTNSQHSIYMNSNIYVNNTSLPLKDSTPFVGLLDKNSPFHTNRQDKILTSPNQYPIDKANYGQGVIDKKLDLAPRARLQERRYSKSRKNDLQSFKSYQLPDSNIINSKSKENTIIFPYAITTKPSNQSSPYTKREDSSAKKVKFNQIYPQKHYNRNNQQDNQITSLSEITQQFKILLQSDKRIEHEQSVNQDDMAYYVEEQLVHQPQTAANQDQKIEITPFVRYFQEIKEQDEDISYSIDEGH